MAGMDHSMPMANTPAGALGNAGRAMPGIEALYKKVDKSKVALVILLLDDDQAKVRKFVENRGYTFLVYRRTGDLPAPFDSNSIPSTVILGPDGQVTIRHDGMAEYGHVGIQSFAGAVGKNRSLGGFQQLFAVVQMAWRRNTLHPVAEQYLHRYPHGTNDRTQTGASQQRLNTREINSKRCFIIKSRKSVFQPLFWSY